MLDPPFLTLTKAPQERARRKNVLKTGTNNLPNNVIALGEEGVPIRPDLDQPSKTYELTSDSGGKSM